MIYSFRKYIIYERILKISLKSINRVKFNLAVSFCPFSWSRRRGAPLKGYFFHKGSCLIDLPDIKLFLNLARIYLVYLRVLQRIKLSINDNLSLRWSKSNNHDNVILFFCMKLQGTKILKFLRLYDLFNKFLWPNESNIPKFIIIR